jgi:hypothetical protein
MSTTNPPQSEPELRDLWRRVLLGTCLVAIVFSAFFAAHGVLMTMQIVDAEIPAGRIDAIVGQTKSGPRLLLDNGREVIFSSSALFEQPTPVKLAVGDRVEKQRGSLVYVHNGKRLTDFAWVRRTWLLPAQVLVPLGAYLVVTTGYVVAYRRTPLGDWLWADASEKRPHRPRTRVGMIAAAVVVWLAVALFMTALFGCIGGCLSGIVRAARAG